MNSQQKYLFLSQNHFNSEFDNVSGRKNIPKALFKKVFRI